VVVGITTVAGNPPIRPGHILRHRAGRVAAVATHGGAAGAGRTPAAAEIVRPIDAEADRPRGTGAGTERGRVLDRPTRRLRRRGRGGHRRRGLVDRRDLTRLVAGGGEAIVVRVATVAGNPPIRPGHILRHRARRVAAIPTHGGAAGAGRTPAAAEIVRPIDAEADRPRGTGAPTERGRVLDRPTSRLRRRGRGGHRRRGLVDRRGLTRLVAGGGEAIVVRVATIAGDPPIVARYVLGHPAPRLSASPTHGGAAGAGGTATARSIIRPVDAEADGSCGTGAVTERGCVLNGPARRGRGRGA